MFEFKLPDLGEGVHEGEVLQWFVKPGDTIAEDAPLIEVETDKAAVTIPSPRGGRVVSIHGEVGQVIHTGDVICVIDTAGAKPSAKKSSEPAKAAEPTKPVEAPTVAAAAPAAAKSAAMPASEPGRPVPAAPATRKLARELGVDLRLVPSSGPGGRVTPEDVRAFASGAPAARPVAASDEPVPAFVEGAAAVPFVVVEPLPDFSVFGPVEKEQLRSVRRKIAVRMATSMTIVPHVAHIDDADVTDLEAARLRLREAAKDKPEGRITLLSFVAKAVVSALRAFPGFNASLDPVRQEIVYKRYYNLGIACDSPKGLVVPVVRGADGLSIAQIAAQIADVAARARAEKLAAQDFQGGTFTITNIGPIGGRLATPVINYPEVAILAMFRVEERPVVRDGQIVIRKMLPLVLGFDHRVVDGADAARFVNHVIARVQDPIRLLVEA